MSFNAEWKLDQWFAPTVDFAFVHTSPKSRRRRRSEEGMEGCSAALRDEWKRGNRWEWERWREEVCAHVRKQTNRDKRKRISQTLKVRDPRSRIISLWHLRGINSGPMQLLILLFCSWVSEKDFIELPAERY